MPQMYGIEHIIYLIVTFTVSITALILIKRFVKSEKGVAIAVKCTAAILFCFILWNRISISCYSSNGWRCMFPDSYCGTTSLALSLCALFLKKDSKVFHCLVYMGIVGGAATVFYPDFIGQADSIFFSKTISGLLHHSTVLFLAILMIATGYIKPTIKRWYCLPLGLCCYVTYGMLLMSTILDRQGTTMYLNSPIIEGTCLTWYFTGAILLTVHAVSLSALELYRKHKNKKLTGENSNEAVKNQMEEEKNIV